MTRYPNLYEVRLIPTKKEIAFVEYMDENSASAAKDALHNYKLDGEGKIKVRFLLITAALMLSLSHIFRLRSQGSECYGCVISIVRKIVTAG